MFDEMMKEAFDIPLVSRMRFLAEMQRPFGVPSEPVLTVDTAAGLFKVASIIGATEGDEALAAQELERQAMTDPQVQLALDFQQLKNERDEAMNQVRVMNQQLFDAQAAQVMADQQAQMMSQQIMELQNQIEQETGARQQAQQEMIASKDQSLQEQISLQDQKQQMNMAAQSFQEQANMLAQQLKTIAAQPTASSARPAGPPGAEIAQAAAQGALPPPMTADAAKEQREAANAEQEAAIQGQQAAAATEEDMAKQDAAARAQAAMEEQGGVPPEAIPKAAADISALALQIRQGMKKQASFFDGTVGGRPLSTVKMAARMDAKTQGAIIGAAIGALGGIAGGAVPGMTAGATDSPGSRASGSIRGFSRGALAGAAAGAAGGALVGHTMASGQSKKQLGRIVGGAALILGAPIFGAVSGARGAQKDKGFHKSAMSLGGKIMAPIIGASAGGASGALIGGAGGALAAEKGARLEALKRGAGVGALTGALGGGLGGVVFGAGGRPMTGMSILGASPTAAALAGAAAGKRAAPRQTADGGELRQLLPEEQMPKAAALSKYSQNCKEAVKVIANRRRSNVARVA